MAAPLLIKQAIEDWKLESQFYIINDEADYTDNRDFTLVKDGYVSWGNGEGQIKSLEPLVITTTQGNDMNGIITPLFPYVQLGSIIEATNSVKDRTGVKNSKNFPMIIIDTLDRPDEPINDSARKYDYRIIIGQDFGQCKSGVEHWEQVYEPILIPIARQVEDVLESIGMVDKNPLVYSERYGDSKKYGRDFKNAFDDIVDVIEITGSLTYNTKKLEQCQR